eukprot:TRINITY_DN15367_c0_g1_i3.p2 TRINITY_DN15367_c0_g1~~TRINITY_DN15367_c0_g1_i3.p2  ORF type:complete len:175 (-),score=30.48 TRINITY_DN15367_c0_g1_i3:104-628(-)
MRREGSKKPTLPHPKLSKSKDNPHKLTVSISLSTNQDSRGNLRLNKLIKGTNSNSSLNLTAAKKLDKENVKPNANGGRKRNESHSTLKRARNNRSQLSFRHNATDIFAVKERVNMVANARKTCERLNVEELESIALFPKLHTACAAFVDMKLLYKSTQFVCEISPDLELFASLM